LSEKSLKIGIERPDSHAMPCLILHHGCFTMKQTTQDVEPRLTKLRLALMTAMHLTAIREETVPACPKHPAYFVDRCPVCTDLKL